MITKQILIDEIDQSCNFLAEYEIIIIDDSYVISDNSYVVSDDS